MKKFYGEEERRIANIKPKVEIPPELEKKQRKEEKKAKKNKRQKR